MSDSKTIAEQTDWPIFICYRQADGGAVAELVYKALHGGVSLFTPEGYRSPPPISVYYDQTAPAVPDWTAVHAPSLQRARTFIFVCSPGAYSRLDDDDWVYRELDWWLEHRQGPPILITTHGDRWVPKELHKRWPNAQRLSVDVERLAHPSEPGYEEVRLTLRSRILEGIRDTAVQVLYGEVEREKARTKQLVWQRRFLVALLILATASAIAAGAFYKSATSSELTALIESAHRLVSQAASLQEEHRPYAAAATLLHAMEVVSRAQNDDEIERLRAGIWERLRNLDIRPTTFLEGHISAVKDIDVSSDGTLAVTGAGGTGSQDYTVRLWDLNRGRQLAVFDGHKAVVLRVRFDPRSNAIVSASSDGAIKIWDVPSRSMRCEVAPAGKFTFDVATVDFSRDSKAIFARPDPATYGKVGPLWWWSAYTCLRAKSPGTATPEMTILVLRIQGLAVYCDQHQRPALCSLRLSPVRIHEDLKGTFAHFLHERPTHQPRGGSRQKCEGEASVAKIG